MPWIAILVLLGIWLRSKKGRGGEFYRHIGFFHPPSCAGGGGEKVLFQAIKAVQDDVRFGNDRISLYTGSINKPKEILTNARERFNIRVHHSKN